MVFSAIGLPQQETTEGDCVTPVGSNHLCRVTSTTRVIAIDLPNTQVASALPWGDYRTSVDAIEDSTGLDNLSPARQRAGGGGRGGG